MLADFFKKDVTAYPSGSRSLGDKSRNSFYERALSKAGLFLTTVAVAASLTACGPSRAEIDAMKAQVPDSIKTEIIAKCDSALLANIDADFLAGGHNSSSSISPFGVVLNPEIGEKLANAVMNGYNETRNQIYDTIPSVSQRTGEHYVLLDYMNECSDKAIGSKSEMKLCTMGDGIKLRPAIVHYGKPEFRQELAQKVQAHQNQKAAVATKLVQQQAGR